MFFRYYLTITNTSTKTKHSEIAPCPWADAQVNATYSGVGGEHLVVRNLVPQYILAKQDMRTNAIGKKPVQECVAPMHLARREI